MFRDGAGSILEQNELIVFTIIHATNNNNGEGRGKEDEEGLDERKNKVREGACRGAWFQNLESNLLKSGMAHNLLEEVMKIQNLK